MAGFVTTIEIARPVETVFRRYLDPKDYAKWVEGYRRMESVRGEPASEGSEHRLFFSDRGREVLLEETILSVVPNREFRYVMRTPFSISEVRVEFTEAAGHTHMRWENSVHGRNLFWHLLLPLMVWRIRGGVERNLARLKSLIETGA